jgi:hypothetical protein
MREILFRGQTYIDNIWKYGMFSTNRSESIIAVWIERIEEFIRYGVYHETVGQYTGLKDKNGKKIFEGDIVKSYDGIFASPVEWNESYCGFYPFCAENTSFHVDECEIIGNVYDKEFKTIEN